VSTDARRVEAPGSLGAFPALIAIHRMDPAADVDNAHRSSDPLALQLGQEPTGLLRRYVAPVGNRVHRNTGNADRRCQSNESAQMVDVAVHTTVGDEPNDMERARAGPCTLARRNQSRRISKIVCRGVRDAHQILSNHPARTNREVPDLRITHLPVRKTDLASRSDQLAVWAVQPKPIENRRVGELDGVAGPWWRNAPAIEDDKDDRRGHGRAAAAIASRLSASSAAPPTSAPSTSGSAISSAAFSGLTEPP